MRRLYCTGEKPEKTESATKKKSSTETCFGLPSECQVTELSKELGLSGSHSIDPTESTTKYARRQRQRHRQRQNQMARKRTRE